MSTALLLSAGTQRPTEDSKSGYLHPDYADSLKDWGEPHFLEGSKGTLLCRPIPGAQATDAIGCYPYFSCMHWEKLAEDIHGLPRSTVSVTLVTDPFADVQARLFGQLFRDKFTLFKNHFVADLTISREDAISRHHIKDAMRALKAVDVELCLNPAQHIDEWCELYNTLIARHNIGGMQLFSRSIFFRQLAVPGVVLLKAVHMNQTVGMNIWYINNDVAYYHLAAFSDLGYKLGTSYALMWSAWETFRSRVRWLCLGASPDASTITGGLAKFKQGWSTGKRSSYLCGRIINAPAYSKLVRLTGTEQQSYFPQYRYGEFF